MTKKIVQNVTCFASKKMAKKEENKLINVLLATIDLSQKVTIKRTIANIITNGYLLEKP